MNGDPSLPLDAMVEPKLPAQTAFERKEALYFEVCQHFEKGRSWQRALAAYKELAWQYEQNTFDFSKLARAQRAMAGIHERIAKGDRFSPRYFRVIYKGLGFPVSLRDKEFIFEGRANDRLATFEDRVQQLHPAAHIIRSKVEPEVEGQYLQIFAVSPHKNLGHTVYQRTKVSQAAREHALLSNPQQFATTTRNPALDVPITEQVVEKIIYTTAEPFPTILRRSEIVKTDNVTLSPIHAAVERTVRKTQELLSLEKRISSGEDEGGMNRMSEDLLLSVDPNSESSVARYRSLLPASEVPETDSQEVDPANLDEEDMTLDPMQNALKVALLDHALAIRRCLSLYNRSAYLATRAEIVPRFEATFEHELATLFPQSAGLMNEPSPDTSIKDQQSTTQSATAMDQAAAGAPNGTEEQPAAVEEERPRQGRRSSIPWLSRRSSAKQMNGSIENGRSHSRQSSRGRLRDRSLTRRLSFFRSSEDRHRGQSQEPTTPAATAADVRPSISTMGRPETQATNYSSMSTAQLKKRLSFLRHSQQVAGGVTATGEHVH